VLSSGGFQSYPQHGPAHVHLPGERLQRSLGREGGQSWFSLCGTQNWMYARAGIKTVETLVFILSPMHI